MDTSLVSMEDMEYLAGQSAENMNVILSSMTALMDDNNEKTAMLETQTWFQRMSRTISGKNKMTQAEIRQNHDKINLYLSQAMSELFDRSCIDQQIIMSLGTRLNELYADHIQLKQMLGAFVDKLNQKIISIDNFHMLETEIEQGVYDGLTPVSAMCKVLSQLDTRTLNDNRKMDILERSLRGKGIISEKPAAVSEYLMALLDTADREIGIIYMELETLGDNVIAVIFKDVIENYHFLSGLSRKIRKKEEVAKKVIQQNQLDDSVEFSLEDIYHELLNAKVMAVPRIEQKTETLGILQGSDELRKGTDAFLRYSVDEAMELLEPLNDGFAKYLISFLFDEIILRSDESASCLEEGHILGNLFASVRYAKRCTDKTKAVSIIQENIEELKHLATDGNLFAQYEYAVLCSERSRFKIPHDGVNVRELLQKAADQGFWMAKYQLAKKYRYGDDGDVNDEKAFQLLYDLDKIGMPAATIELAYFYDTGLYVEENKKTAVKLFEKAAQVTPQAKCNLGLCYEFGDGVYKDIEKATDLYVECITETAGDIMSDVIAYMLSERQFSIKPIKPQHYACIASFRMYFLKMNEADAAMYLCIAAKCGDSRALYECAKFYLTDGKYDYLEKFPDSQYCTLADVLFPYDLEMAKYCLAEAKERTKDEELLSDIESLELKISIGKVKEVFTGIKDSIKNLF